jgi:hypothetical protein
METGKRHKWNGKILSKRVDGGSVFCIKCGMIKQYVAGVPTYFINDTMYYPLAPKCEVQTINQPPSTV